MTRRDSTERLQEIAVRPRTGTADAAPPDAAEQKPGRNAGPSQNPEGILSLSPALPRSAATLGQPGACPQL